MNISRFLLKMVESFSKAKYVTVVSQHKEDKKILLYEVDGSAEIVEEIDEDICLKRNFFGMKK